MKEPELPNVRDVAPPILRRFSSPSHPIPSSHLLSNGVYSVMITAAGSGYSRWGGLGITRWREDVTLDARGSFIYVRDIGNGNVWSATYQPVCVEADHYEAVFSEDRARITRTDESLRSELEVLVSSEDDVELRRLSLTNTGNGVRELEITSYLEVVLAPPDADRAHPAFSNLFIQTEYLHEERALLATRRPRSANEHRNYMALALATDLEALGGTEYETDRAKFIGRNRDLSSPVSVMDGRPLSNTVGSVLDPILSLRTRIRIQPGATVRLLFATIASKERETLVGLVEKYRSPGAFERTSSLVWTHSQARLYHLGIDPAEALVFQRLANRVLFSDPLLRPSSETLKKNRLTIQGLWGRGISGDLPIVLVRVDDGDDQPLVRQFLRAHEYWRFKGLAVDIVILNEKGSSYVQDFQSTLEGLARASESTSAEGGRHGRVYVLRYDLLDPRERELLLAVARAVINSREGSLAEQVGRTRNLPLLVGAPHPRAEAPTPGPAPLLPTLEFFNGLGGFSTDGREYVTVLEKDLRTPAPWINVVANEQFGFHVSESGSGYTWSVNSRENQLTPWSNDPVSDPAGEAFYFRDLDDNAIWTGTASPIRIGGAVYIARHGMGYSVFETGIAGIQSELAQFVGGKDSLKVSRIRLTNRSNRYRKIEVTAYVEWVLGFSRSQTAHSIVVERDSETGALFATNPLNADSGRRVAFLDLGGRQSSFTASRTEFVGRNGSLARPAALLNRDPLDGASGAGLDPCGVIRTEVAIRAGESIEISCFLGEAEDAESARRLILEWRKKNLETELRAVQSEWARFLDTVQVATPDRSLDVLLNAWLPYQTYVCRFLARAAFYQAGGAYGFRDQLQDVVALATGRPQVAREHILRAASRQFVEGDVQHWWHPPSGRGVRTHFSDDLLWLPFVVLRYLTITGDKALLDERVPYLQGPLLPQAQEDAYFEPTVAPPQSEAKTEESVFEHCARTLDRSLHVGVHGLPLMGTGDWNDGMNRVGHEGRGESVWVGWFLYAILKEMAPVATTRGETVRAEAWLTHAERLKTALETEAWDGEWYRRAFFDDGTPLGSATNAECRIDSIAQTWAVLSGAADPARAIQAMSSVERHLVRAQDDLILLFSPPFDRTDKDPGYIKGYLPGVRENGGQYTHAAVWCVCAYAQMGNGNRAHELFSMLNPINHGSTRTDIQCYKVEPYVMAADIYGESPHIGRGGWTWYTGSSGWMYRAGVEFILGIRKESQNLFIDPCIPERWPGFQAVFRHGDAVYEIQVANPRHVSRGVARLQLDGQMLDPVGGVPLNATSGRHRVVATLGDASE